MSRRRKILLWAVALLVFVPAATVGWFFLSAAGKIGNVDRSEHVARNEAVLDQIPVYPGVRFLQTQNIESKDGNGWPEGMGPITSWSTSHVYEYPPGDVDRPAVIDWYRSRLAARCDFRGGSGSEGQFFDATFRCGNSLVFIAAVEDVLEIRADFDRITD